MKKWKIERKYISIAVLALITIIAASAFYHFLEQETKYATLKATISGTMLPIIAGFILAYLLNPVLKFLEKTFFMPLAEIVYEKSKQEKTKAIFSRTLGIISTLAIFLTLLIGGCCLVIPQVYVSIMKIVEDVPAYYYDIERWIMTFLEGEQESIQYILGMLDGAYSQFINLINTTVIPNMDKIVSGITIGIIGGLKIILNIILAIIISIYVLAEKERLISYGKKLTYSYFSMKHAKAIIAGVRYANNVFGGFIGGKIIDSFIIGVICYIFMVMVNFEYPVLISIIIGITNILPYFGPFIGAIPSILILLMTEPKQGLIFAIFVLVLQQVDGNIIGPLILGDRLKISSMWILIAILIGGGLFGVPGMILGAPTLACLYALIGSDCRKRLRDKDLPQETEEYLNFEPINKNDKI